MHRGVGYKQTAAPWVKQVGFAVTRVVSLILAQLRIAPLMTDELVALHLILVKSTIRLIPYVQPAIAKLTQGIAARLELR
ncbi:hypothetical protein DN820_07775 [Stutzerimonas nosocomialis]|uniref:Uncharacterized protein n=1 Tax=Stutzerimonas nosocomialis TaxID=1056496 RepID=A0A5R9QGB2_9GAMM|nr:hypothetical protein DN820_07775 [Stutzerimonas nosocomialis]